jgi:hypothetical protein
MSTEEILTNIIGTVLGGIIFTIILFLTKEHILPKKNITGEWKSITLVQNSNHQNFKNLSIEFKIHLLQRGEEIIGSGEKIKDSYSDGTFKEYDAKERPTLEIIGYYEKQYLKKSRVYLNIVEKGSIRESRTTYKLIVKSAKKLEGTFQSTVSNSIGSISMEKVW